jgi:transcriptional regulator with XRE-family HTH domain
MHSTELGQQILRRRKAQKLSQQALAEKAGVSRNYISLIERGEANVSTGILEQIATVFGVPPAELLGHPSQDQMFIPPTLREFGLRESLSFEVIDKLARIPKPDQEPDTVEGWGVLYEAIRPYVEGTESPEQGSKSSVIEKAKITQ